MWGSDWNVWWIWAWLCHKWMRLLCHIWMRFVGTCDLLADLNLMVYFVFMSHIQWAPPTNKFSPINMQKATLYLGYMYWSPLCTGGLRYLKSNTHISPPRFSFNYQTKLWAFIFGPPSRWALFIHCFILCSLLDKFDPQISSLEPLWKWPLSPVPIIQ